MKICYNMGPTGLALVIIAVSYNIQMLPWGVTSYGPAFLGATNFKSERMQGIWKFLSKEGGGMLPDVIGFQEVFHPGIRDKLLELAVEEGYYTHWGDGGTLLNRMFGNGNGLVFISKYPIIEESRVVFNYEDSSITSSDYAVSKGILYCEVNIKKEKEGKDHIVGFVVTHPQSSNGDDDFHTRRDNMRELSNFIKNTKKENVPIVLLGDLNINSMVKEEEEFLVEHITCEFSEDMVLVTNIPKDNKKKESFPEGKLLLDYIFIIRSKMDTLHTESVLEHTKILPNATMSPYGDLKIPLSDHMGVVNNLKVYYKSR